MTRAHELEADVLDVGAVLALANLGLVHRSPVLRDGPFIKAGGTESVDATVATSPVLRDGPFIEARERQHRSAIAPQVARPPGRSTRMRRPNR